MESRSSDAGSVAQQARASEQDSHLKKSLGFWSLTATGIGSVIGSGWLLAANAAANFAGPAAIISWLIGGGLMLLIALVFAELGMVRPESGGLVRYPLYTNGRLAASVVGWAMWLSYVGNPPSEASAVVQYASTWWGAVYDSDAHKLTPLGIAVAIGLMALFVVINILGVEAFARANNALTSVKVIIPTLTVILLLISGFDHTSKAGGLHDNIAATGFAPYGYSAALGAIAAGGLIFSYTGFRNIIELSGEARNPRRDIPRAMIVTIVFAVVLYLGLQFAFLGAVPGADAAKGWHLVNFDSPFADLAKLLGMMWLYWLLIADSSISPSGSGIVYTAANSRNVFGLAKNGFFPSAVMKVDPRRGVPIVALLLNFVIGIAFLLPLPSWQQIVQVMSAMAALTFSIGSVSVMVFRRVGYGHEDDHLRGMSLIAPAAFAISSLVIFWEEWDPLYKTIPIVAVGVVWYAVTLVRAHHRDLRDLWGGLWLVVYLVFVYGLSALSSFKGTGTIPAPWDSILVAAGSLVIYAWAVRAGTTFLRDHDEMLEVLDHPKDAVPSTA
ncbi:APC family permease [Branchiibius sp. NY16-3462-2]|uniref:APC family permease n=1 Tax=Branchiibius sp. NY16-3462-2 TaxID=1807500 RepID=UPI000796ACFD|nr:APC family permease [Branchiibius sp. NY16-3462-2]KYH43205.1 amino acid permease [Branchiibius sp. NY16-3462-2]